MESKRIESIKNWPEPQSIREIQIFIGFANFYRRYIQIFIATAGLFTSMLKANPDSMFSKRAKKDTVKLTKQDSTSFFTLKAKKSFQNLEKAFYEESVLHHFYLSKPIRFQSDTSGEAITGVLCQQKTDMK